MEKVYLKVLDALVREYLTSGIPKIAGEQLLAILTDNGITEDKEIQKFAEWMSKPKNQREFKKRLNKARIKQ